MAQHEHNGSGAESESPDRSEPIRRPLGAAEELDEPATESTPGPSTPSPREQWFGGFEGEAPPPPPYARLPEDTPPPVPGTAYAAPDPEAESVAGVEDDNDEDTGDEPAETGGGTVRLMPGVRRSGSGDTPWREEEPRIPPRPSRPGRVGREDQDPLGPRRIRGDSDVPEPEQLPPLEAERTERSDVASPEPVERAEPLRDRSGQVSSGRNGPSATTGSTGSTGTIEPTGPTEGTEKRERGGDLVSRGTSSSFRPSEYEPGVTSDALNAATLVRNRRQGPTGGWRRAVHTASLGLINPGESPKVLRERELVARASTPVATGHHRVAVLSLKGGVGKTTTTVALGATLGSLRGDRVLAVDANPDRGTLSDKVRLETAATIRDLLNERHLVSRYADIRGFTSQAPSRLEILASDRDPAVSEAFSDEDYREVARIVEHFYSICITDCGTGLLHSAMSGVLGLADQVVLVSSASVDGARSASATLDWLEAHGHGALVAGAVVVLSMVRSNSKSSVDLDRLEDHFAGRCRSVVRVPWDGHLEEGAEVDLDRLAPATKDAYLQLAANVGEAFAHHR
ncbi:MinD/ParA family ATP-binding protein [Nocardiopsis listeri]|uniref:MinD/ParA family ATP-binding protein n=1 Tax=Nocardiopsis listeri TaxID=53440 RepID=UPI0009FE07D6|nr:MinD/ParA family protein [Nocardiopsis listeri]